MLFLMVALCCPFLPSEYSSRAVVVPLLKCPVALVRRGLHVLSRLGPFHVLFWGQCVLLLSFKKHHCDGLYGKTKRKRKPRHLALFFFRYFIRRNLCKLA